MFDWWRRLLAALSEQRSKIAEAISRWRSTTTATTTQDLEQELAMRQAVHSALHLNTPSWQSRPQPSLHDDNTQPSRRVHFAEKTEDLTIKLPAETRKRTTSNASHVSATAAARERYATRGPRPSVAQRPTNGTSFRVDGPFTSPASYMTSRTTPYGPWRHLPAPNENTENEKPERVAPPPPSTSTEHLHQHKQVEESTLAHLLQPRDDIRYNLLSSPRRIADVTPKQLDEPATSSLAASMRIMVGGIAVEARAYHEGAAVTAVEVLDALRLFLFKQVTPSAWQAASPSKQTTAAAAFYKRIGHAGSPESIMLQRALGVLAIDWLGDATWFGGLQAVAGQPGTWTLLVTSERS
ncbi:hypothetical protein BKA62DRAFT_770368 [Auriculariales sp. MPI-PUGE-AT-0066]|nr:hypothetical protein BKA62DRAFT_770368 [Auriculariales sp. MPI-PUGE-AT-0066]